MHFYISNFCSLIKYWWLQKHKGKMSMEAGKVALQVLSDVKIWLLVNSHFGQYKKTKVKLSGFLLGKLAQIDPAFVPHLDEVGANELLLDQLSQLGLLVDLSQHLVHHAEQRTAQAQQLIQEHIVMWIAPDVGPHSCERLTHTFQQPLRQYTHSLASTPWPA